MGIRLPADAFQPECLMGASLDKPIVKKTTETASANGLSFAVSAMQGYRVSMEDAHVLVPSLEGQDLPEHAFVGVYDGHGGEQTALLAAKHLLNYIVRRPEFDEYRKAWKTFVAATDCQDGSTSNENAQLLGKAISAGILKFDRELPELLKDSGLDDSSGSTANIVFITPTHLVCANVGDSRAVCRTHEAGINGTQVSVALSEDHKCSLPEEKKRIEAAGGQVLADRVDGCLAMSRALGDFVYKDTDTAQSRQKVSPVPDIFVKARVDSADELLVLACDGIWDVMSNGEVCDLCALLLSDGERNVGLVVEELLDSCLDKKSGDNMTAILVTLPAAKFGMQTESIIERRRAKRAALENKSLDHSQASSAPDKESSPCEEMETLANTVATIGGTSSRPRRAQSKPAPRPASSTSAELARLKAVFNELDLDGNGTLDRDEVKAASIKLGNGVSRHCKLRI